MDLVFMSTFDNQSMSMGCVGNLFGHLFGFLRHYLLNKYYVRLKCKILEYCTIELYCCDVLIG